MSRTAKHTLTVERCDAWIAQSGAIQHSSPSTETRYNISQDDLRRLVAHVFKAGANVDVLSVGYREPKNNGALIGGR